MNFALGWTILSTHYAIHCHLFHHYANFIICGHFYQMSECWSGLHKRSYIAHTLYSLISLVSLRIPSSRSNPRTFPQFVRIRIHWFLAAIYYSFETISRRPEIERYPAQMHVARCMAIINATTVIALHTFWKSSAHPQRVWYTLIERQARWA